MLLNNKITIFLLAFIMLLFQMSIAIAEVEVTPMLGYRTGGEFNAIGVPATLKLEEAETYGVTIDIDHGKYQQITVLYSRQETSLRTSQFGVQNPLFDVDVEYLHIGGNQIWIKEKMRPFFGATVGATHFNTQEYSSTTRLSFSIGGGSKFFLTKRIALMVGARAYATLFNSSSSIFCGNNGCSAAVSGSALFQFEATAGVTFRF